MISGFRTKMMITVLLWSIMKLVVVKITFLAV